MKSSIKTGLLTVRGSVFDGAIYGEHGRFLRWIFTVTVTG